MSHFFIIETLAYFLKLSIPGIDLIFLEKMILFKRRRLQERREDPEKKNDDPSAWKGALFSKSHLKEDESIDVPANRFSSFILPPSILGGDWLGSQSPIRESIYAQRLQFWV